MAWFGSPMTQSSVELVPRWPQGAGRSRSSGREEAQQRILGEVDILVLVHEDGAESSAVSRKNLRPGCEKPCGPRHKVVEIEGVRPLELIAVARVCHVQIDVEGWYAKFCGQFGETARSAGAETGHPVAGQKKKALAFLYVRGESPDFLRTGLHGNCVRRIHLRIPGASPPFGGPNRQL